MSLLQAENDPQTFRLFSHFFLSDCVLEMHKFSVISQYVELLVQFY